MTTSKRKPKAEPKPRGRESTFTQAIADTICDRISNGESLTSICVSPGMPTKPTVLRWLKERPDLQTQYALAREAQADALADEILHIANTPQMGEKRKRLPGGKVEVTTGDMIEHRRLQIDARKWLAGKLRPKKYGDKLEHSGQVDGVISVSFLAADEKIM